MLRIGKIASIHNAGSKTIVAVSLMEDFDSLNFIGACIKFDIDSPAISISGNRWWPARQSVDLLFDRLDCWPSVEDPVYFTG